jgi:hypothetical protein
MRWGTQHLQRACWGLVGYSKQVLANFKTCYCACKYTLILDLLLHVQVHAITLPTQRTRVQERALCADKNALLPYNVRTPTNYST